MSTTTTTVAAAAAAIAGLLQQSYQSHEGALQPAAGASAFHGKPDMLRNSHATTLNRETVAHEL